MTGFVATAFTDTGRCATTTRTLCSSTAGSAKVAPAH